ncbi:MAG: hypothetical protein ABI652_08255 [Acidobacteriota bacterium]
MAAFSLIELIFALGLAATLGAVAIPETLSAVDEARATGAARYVAAQLQRTRMEAITRNAATAMKVTSAGSDYTLTAYVDGNRNGVLSREIQSGVDRAVAAVERLGDRFPGVTFGTLPGLPPVDTSSTAPGSDPVRLGSSDLAVFSPIGTATSGSLYILGRRNIQLVVRIYGETGKTRALRFNARTRQWLPLTGA